MSRFKAEVQASRLKMQQVSALLAAIVVQNHPGHDQKSHGRKGGRSEADMDALPTGAAALGALPGTYDRVIDRAVLGGRESVRLRDAVGGEHGYTRDGYIETNRALYEARGGSLESAPGHVQEQVSSIDRLMEMSRTGEEIAVHRGTLEPSQQIPGFNPAGGNEGLEWTHHAFESTSARHQIAEEFARGHNASALHRVSTENHPTEMRIAVPRGVGAVQLTGMDRFDGEGDGKGYAEVLLDRGLPHRIVNDHGVVNGVHFLDVEIVS